MPSETDYDVIIVGGGPAGSTCASYLAKQNHKVLLVDKATFPRDKACGDGISGKSLAALQELGIDVKVEKAKHRRISGVIFSSPKGKVVEIPVKQEGKHAGYDCRRFVYDNVLFQHAKELVETIEGFSVTGVVKEGDQVVGVKGIDTDTKKERTFRAKIIVGADGANSGIAKSMGLHRVDPKHHSSALRMYYKNVAGMKDMIEIHFTDSIIPGYFWIFPLEDNIANVGIGMIIEDMSKKHINLKDAMFDIINNNPLFKERFKNAEMVEGTLKGWNLPLGSKRRKCHGDGFLLIGDAASLIDPFTGEGIGNAMISGKLAASVINEAIIAGDYSQNTLKKYEELLSRTLDNEFKTSYRMQKLGSIKFLLNFVINRATKNQHIRDMISTTLIDRETRKEYTSPWFYLKMLFS